MRSTRSVTASRGFSLLEMMVAISILAVALVSLYQAASGATRNVRGAEKYAYGVELARSLLADNAVVPLDGVNIQGETSGRFRWRVSTQPVDLNRTAMTAGSLHNIEVGVSWLDGSKSREVILNSVVEGR